MGDDLAAAGGGVSVFAIWLWWHTGSAANVLESPTSVMVMLKYLVDHGLDRAELRFQVRGQKDQRLVFVKRIGEGDEVCIESVFNDSPAIPGTVAELQHALDQAGIRYVMIERQRGPRSLVVHYGRDLSRAVMVVGLLFNRVVGVQVGPQIAAYFKYVLAPDQRASGSGR